MEQEDSVAILDVEVLDVSGKVFSGTGTGYHHHTEQ